MCSPSDSSLGEELARAGCWSALELVLERGTGCRTEVSPGLARGALGPSGPRLDDAMLPESPSLSPRPGTLVELSGCSSAGVASWRSRGCTVRAPSSELGAEPSECDRDLRGVAEADLSKGT